MIFYFHGFASSGSSWKVESLKETLSGVKIFAPTWPVDPAGVVEFYDRESALQGKPRLLIGSSLGGFYALYLACRDHLPAVLINPSVTPWRTLAGYVGTHKRYYSGDSFEWKTDYLETLELMGEELKGFGSNEGNLHFFLAADDEVLDLQVIPGLFPGAGTIRFFDNCGHSFMRFPEIIPIIRPILLT